MLFRSTATTEIYTLSLHDALPIFMNGLAAGQMSDPLTSRFGVHLIQVLERRTTQLSTRDQRELARNVLREKKQEEAYTLWAQEVRGRAYVEYRDPPL